MSEVYLNGRLVGIHPNPIKLVERLRQYRRKNKISSEVNIGYHKDADNVMINTGPGRVRRPLIVVENGKPKLTEELLEKLKEGKLTWSDLVEKGVIEYLDAEEEENALIALKEEDLTPEHTHLEISPTVIFGLPASTLPFCDHNAAVRAVYGSKDLKQSIGLYIANYRKRFDTDISILHYPQAPLVVTKAYQALDLDQYPSGQNFVIAVMPFYGYNIEDAIVLNRASIDRGLARSTYFRPYEAQEQRYPGGQRDRIEIPDKEVRGYKTEEVYRHLDEDGVAGLETKVDSDEVIIGKTSPPRFLGALGRLRIKTEARRDTSVSIRHGEKGIVDSVMVTTTKNGDRYIRVRVRDERIPELGDKFESRHGQKGVIGLIVPPEDMPFTENGLVPDLIFNPHGIPSRRSLGHLLEILAGKAAALSGEIMDATPFQPVNETQIKETLKSYGFDYTGKEKVYNGVTGEVIEAEIYVGIVFYQKLRHMVANKLHARSRGPIQILTRQPTEGKAKEGGLRLGEMEQWCLVSHGASLLLKERWSSDSIQVPICNRCGLVAIYDRIKGKVYCPLCKGLDVSFIELSYAFKILLDELMSFGIYPRLNVKSKW